MSRYTDLDAVTPREKMRCTCSDDGSNEDPPEIDFSMFDFMEDDDETNS